MIKNRSKVGPGGDGAHKNWLEALRSTPLLQGVADEHLSPVLRAVQVRKFDRGATVIRKGSPGDHLVFCLHGKLRAVEMTEDGRELGLNSFAAGDILGELSVIDGLPRSASVVAVTPSVTAWLPKPAALQLIFNQPLVAQRMMVRLAESVRRASVTFAIMGAQSVRQRVFGLLQQMVSVAPGGLHQISTPPTQQEMALMINTSRESVSRALGLLIKSGIIEKDLNRIIVRKPDLLKMAAESGMVHDSV